MLAAIAFASVVISTYGQTRFVIDNYTIPDTSDLFALLGPDPPTVDTASPYPLDVCVGYQVGFELVTVTPLKLNVFSYYGMYSCNDEGTTVTFTDYGTDSKCTTAVNTNDKTIELDASLDAGTTGTFNCDGINSYVTISQYTIGSDQAGIDGGNVCCPDGGDYSDVYFGVAPTTFALNVCVFGEVEALGSGYTSGTCDADGSTTTIYSDNACTVSTGETSDELSASSTGCARLGDANAQGSIYQRQTMCVVNDVALDPDPGFGCVTADPTKEPSPAPTPDTDSPTSAPTDEPTEATPSPTEKTEEAKGFMTMVDYVVLLILGMAIFIN